jgi:hypothetical protein
MRKMIFAAVAAVALGTSSVAMAAHGGGAGGHMGGGFGGGHIGGGHIGGGFSGHIGGSFGAGHLGGAQFGGVHPGGGLGLTPHVAGLPNGGGVIGTAPHTFSGVHSNASAGRALAFRDHGHDRFHHRRFGLGGLYAYGPSCTYSPYQTWPNYNNCDPEYYDQNYE